MVSAVIEQVHSSRPTFKLCLLNIQEICALKRTKMHLVAGFRLDPLGELTALPQTL